MKKMKNIHKISILLISATLLMSSCKKDKVTTPEPVPSNPVAASGNLELEFEGMVGDSALELTTKTYMNQAGNSFNITMLKFYISNIKITKTDNSVWTENNSYHLIDYSNPSSSIITIANVPYGDYKAIEFMIGVDSARNTSGAQTGALDVSNGMFWSWNSGYIMAKFEGTSPQSTAVAGKLTFHVGGYSGANKSMRMVSPLFNGDTAKVSSTVTPSIHIKSNVLEWFKTPNAINFSTLNTVHMPGSNALLIANNYADMFSVEHIHN